MKKLNILLSGLLLCGMGLSSCNNEEVLPPVVFPDGGSQENIGSGAWDDPFSVWQVLAGVEMTPEQSGVWVTGYIVGYINTFDGDYAKLREKSAVFSAAGAPNSNLLLAMTPEEKDWEKCIPVQLAYNTNGRDLSLQNHPEYLGRQVTLYGTSGAKYLSVYGLRNCSAYNWGDQGIYIAPPAIFTRTTEMVDGAQYVLVADNKYLAQNISEERTYGYLYCDQVAASLTVEAQMGNTFTFTKSGDYWIITDSFGRYLFQEANAQNFSVSESMPAANYLWSVDFNEDGTATIINVGRNTSVQYDPAYSSYGCYTSKRDGSFLPVLYVLQAE